MNTVSCPLRLGFAGTPVFAVSALEALARAGHTVVAVFTQPDRPAGRGRTVHAGAVKACALALEVPVYQPASLKSPAALALLRSLELDALVVVAYGSILPPAVLAAPRLGCFNIHASLLPRWRGAAPIQRALLAGDGETGITIMRMEAGLDTGPILSMRRTSILPVDTAQTLHDRLSMLGGELIVDTLEAVAGGRAVETVQPADGVTYAEKLDKAEAVIDWRDTAARIVRKVHAFNPWPVAETKLDRTQLRIWEAELLGDESTPAGEPGTVLEAGQHGIDVACGAGRLRIHRLQLAGRKPLAAAEFLKAQRLSHVRFAGA